MGQAWVPGPRAHMSQSGITSSPISSELKAQLARWVGQDAAFCGRGVGGWGRGLAGGHLVERGWGCPAEPTGVLPAPRPDTSRPPQPPSSHIVLPNHVWFSPMIAEIAERGPPTRMGSPPPIRCNCCSWGHVGAARCMQVHIPALPQVAAPVPAPAA